MLHMIPTLQPQLQWIYMFCHFYTPITMETCLLRQHHSYSLRTVSSRHTCFKSFLHCNHNAQWTCMFYVISPLMTTNRRPMPYDTPTLQFPMYSRHTQHGISTSDCIEDICFTSSLYLNHNVQESGDIHTLCHFYTLIKMHSRLMCHDMPLY